MADENKDNSDIYQLRDPSVLTEKVIAPPENSDIFAIKESVIGVTLSAGVSLCNAYRLDKRLTNDETGETWRASDLKASRNVVVYLPPLDIRLDTTAMESIGHTARHVEALEHPRIVPLLDNFTDPEHGFFAVRKFVNGKTLDVYRKEYIKRYKKIVPAKILKILSDVAVSLDYAHRADVVHGAICPKNIIVGLDDEVNIANFALLPIQTFTPVSQQTYLAPEITEGLSPTALSDIYALAVVAYELFAGRLPVPTDAMDDTPLPIPHVPSSVDAVIRKAMTKVPEDRFESCSQFVKELEKGFQGSTKNRSISVTPTHISAKKKLPEGLSYGIMLLVVLCITGIAIWQTQPIYDGKKQTTEDGKQQDVPLLPPVKADGRQQTASDNKIQVEPEIRDSRQQAADDSKIQVEPLSPPGKEDNSQQTVDDSKPHEEQTPLAPQEPVVTEIITEEPTEIESKVIEENVDVSSESESEPPVIEMKIETVEPEIPQQGSVTPSDEQEQEPYAASFANMLREEGEQKSLSIGGIEYRFQWCKGNPYLPNSNGFWIQETLITQAMWVAVMEVHARHQPDDLNTRLPEVLVNWGDIEQFLEKINQLDVLSEEEFKGHRFALPTEKQWERAVPHDKMLEWCNDWSEESSNYRVVRGKNVPPQQRTPSARLENVGFRLVIVPREPAP